MKEEKEVSRACSLKQSVNRAAYFDGLKVGIPIALGYFVVSFALGMQAKASGLTAFQGGLASFTCSASAGEYAGFKAIAENATYLTIVLASLVANARYFLMGCALCQKMSPSLPFRSRAFVALYLTDELFGMAIMRPGVFNPRFAYGIITITVPFWTIGTSLGVVAGNIMPEQWVSALSVALFGMFLAVIVPPGRKNKIVGGLVLVSFLFSYLASKAPFLSEWAEGSRIVLLTVVLASVAAILFPVKEDEERDETENTSVTEEEP